MKIPKASLHLEAAERIRHLIEQGELQPGSRIHERELCETFGISRTPLREALKVLSAEGLIHLTPNRGAQVHKLTREEIEHTFKVMGALEGLAGELACERITNAELSRLQTLHERMLKHFEQHDLSEYFKVNRLIHEAIINIAQNPTLTHIYEGLSGRVQRSRYMANMTREHWIEAVKDHEQMMEALAKRDGKRLSEIMKVHLEHKFVAVSGSEIVSPEKASSRPGTSRESLSARLG